MKLLITGATGFVGRNLLLTALASSDYDEIIVSVRDEPKLRAQLAAEGIEPSPRLRVTRWSDFDSIGPVDQAVHAAGVSFARDRASYFAANVDATLALAAALPRATRLLVLSSQSAGGPTPLGQSARSSADADAPITFYGKSKLEMERRLLAARPNTAIWRPPMILGPRDTATVPIFGIARAPFQIKPGRRPKTYSWIAVDDLDRAILSALRSDDWSAISGRPINAAARDVITDLDLMTTACSVVGNRARILPLPHPAVRLLARVVDAIPPLRRSTPSLTRDRSREIYHDRWVVDSSEFQAQHLHRETATLAATLQAAWKWLEAQRGGVTPANPA